MAGDYIEVEVETAGEGFIRPSPVWSDADLRDLQLARHLLEHPGLAPRLAELIGGPIERGIRRLPAGWREGLQGVSKKSLMSALEVASTTMKEGHAGPAADLAHQLAVGLTGGVGGLFGLASIAWELPLSTTLMLRSMLDVARSEGHSVQDLRTRISCLEVFAFGGRSGADDGAESGYWAVRAGLATMVTDAAAYIAQNGIKTRSAPVLAKLIAAISGRFGVIVSEQVAAKAVPLIGAAAGSAINVMFIQHFQEMARGHFIIRRLEKKHPPEEVEAAYKSMTFGRPR
jgi:hypothetical protein